MENNVLVPLAKYWSFGFLAPI